VWLFECLLGCSLLLFALLFYCKGDRSEGGGGGGGQGVAGVAARVVVVAVG
jgi:hypothetical protein